MSVRFANVNGTGSASANALFTKAVFRMGVPVTPKNIFPSNIQGLPTWYEVRVSEKGYLGRREGVDLMVAVNPQTMKKDYRGCAAGRIFSLRQLKAAAALRMTATTSLHIGIPADGISAMPSLPTHGSGSFSRTSSISGPSSRFVRYRVRVLESLIGEQFKGKEKLIEPNIKALNIGVDYVRENFELSARYSRRTPRSARR